METVAIDVEGTVASFDLDIGNGTWTTAGEVEEAAFPLVAHVDGRRYELYSDGTLAEEELR